MDVKEITAMQKQKALSVTGHRWHKLPFGENEDDSRCKALVGIITGELLQQIERGISHVICGMALGFDTLVAEAAINLQLTAYPHITLEAALICPEHAGKWRLEQRRRLDRILEYCVAPPTITSPVYKTGCEMVRNRYMVDASCILLAGWDGSPSGTGNTVRYAQEKQVPVVQINPRDLGKVKVI